MGNISPRIKVIRGLSGVSMLKISKTCSRGRIPHRCIAVRPRADDPDAGPPPHAAWTAPTPMSRRPDADVLTALVTAVRHPRIFGASTRPHLQRASMPKPQSRSCSKSIRSASFRLHVSCILTPCMLGSASSVFAHWSLGRLRASRFGRLRHHLVFVSSASLACPSRKDLATP